MSNDMKKALMHRVEIFKGGVNGRSTEGAITRALAEHGFTGTDEVRMRKEIRSELQKQETIKQEENGNQK